MYPHMTSRTYCRHTRFVRELTRVPSSLLWKIFCKVFEFSVMRSHMRNTSTFGLTDPTTDVLKHVQAVKCQWRKSSLASKVIISDWSIRFSVLQILYSSRWSLSSLVIDLPSSAPNRQCQYWTPRRWFLTSTVFQLSTEQLLGWPNVPHPGKVPRPLHLIASEDILNTRWIVLMEKHWCLLLLNVTWC